VAVAQSGTSTRPSLLASAAASGEGSLDTDLTCGSSGQRVEADQHARQLHEPQHDVGAPLVAHLQAPVAHQPRQRPLHHIAVAAQPLAGLDATPGDPGRDPASAQRPPATWVVVTLVAVQLGGPLPGSARPPTRSPDRWHGVHHGLQQHRVMGVGRRQPDGQGDAATVGQQVVLGPGLAAVCRIRAGQAAPRLARTLIESRLARDQSSWPWRPSWSNSWWWSCCHTPARYQSRSRRQQVTGLP
jgi:hypothetical protein